MELVGDILGSIILAIILIYPARKTFARAGLSPNSAFWLFVPLIGLLITMSILAFSDWPAARDDGGRG